MITKLSSTSENADVEPKNKKKSIPNSQTPAFSTVIENIAEISEVGVPPKLGAARHGLSVPEDNMDASSLLGDIEESLIEELRLSKEREDLASVEFEADVEPELGSIVEIIETQSSPLLDRSEGPASPTTDTLRTDDMTTPESSLTNLIKEFKTDVTLERQMYHDKASKTTIIETFDANNHEKVLEDDAQNDKEISSLNIEEEIVGQVMCSLNNDNLECKTISPVPSEDFHVPEIQEDLINTIFSDPPPFSKK